ncbi:MAG TPA: sodium-dependent transporter [Longimicrobiales bacterium]|nr:sodium-dependent transporter [Longimicrobiales bacterium]
MTSFTSRWGMMLAMLGMAVGTGNIWRFPRVAAANGGGSFLVAWAVFLLLWSVPLILVEFAMGRNTRYGPVGAFARTMGPKFAWMGAWVAWTATAIMFYYSVVAGWTMRYFWAGVTGELAGEVPGTLWSAYASTPAALVTHALAMGIGVLVVARGVKGIEAAARFLIPSLFVLVVVLAIRAVTLPGAVAGLNFMFAPQWSELANHRIWLEALTQNAWDTGAGWGLIVAYAVYLRRREDTSLNAFLLGFGNNSVSLLAGIMVICTVFAVGPTLAGQFAETPAGFEQAVSTYPGLESRLEEGLRTLPAADVEAALGRSLAEDEIGGFFSNDAEPIDTRLALAIAGGGLEGESVARAVLASGSNGLTFIWVPQIFDTLLFGRALTSLFFLALAFAAISSLIAMIELAVRVLVDGGATRSRAIWIVGGMGFLLGVPSALSMTVFDNQDWVWGVGLMVSGLFFAVAVLRYGVTRFREELINHENADLRIGRWWDWAIRLVVVQAVVLIVWWFAQFGTDDLWGTYGVFNTLAQWTVALGIFLALNRWLVGRTHPEVSRTEAPEGDMPPPSIP